MHEFFSGELNPRSVKQAITDVVYRLPSDDLEALSVAQWLISQYEYRKEFGLSYKEFMNEPHMIYNANVHIMNVVNEKLKRETKKYGGHKDTAGYNRKGQG